MKLWQQVNGWDYYRCNLDEEITEFQTFAPLHGLWNKKRGNGYLPAWKDFDFADFIGWHKHLILYEVLHDPFDLHYRLFGSFPTESYGENFTGKNLSDADPNIEDEYDLLHFKELFQQINVGASTGPVHWHEKEYIKLSFLDLPLSSDGKKITHFLTGMQSETISLSPEDAPPKS